MREAEGELLDAVRQPVVTLSVKDLPYRGKKRASRQPFTRHLPDEAFSGVMRAVLQESKCDLLQQLQLKNRDDSLNM